MASDQKVLCQLKSIAKNTRYLKHLTFLFCQQIWVNNNYAMGASNLTPGGGGGGSDHHKFIQRGPILISDPYPFIHHFWQKRYPSLSTAVNAPVSFKYE